jgi:hypothetical protein
MGKIQYDSERNEVLFQMASINVTEEQFNYSFGHLFGMFRAVISQSADSKVIEAKRG